MFTEANGNSSRDDECDDDDELRLARCEEQRRGDRLANDEVGSYPASILLRLQPASLAPAEKPEGRWEVQRPPAAPWRGAAAGGGGTRLCRCGCSCWWGSAASAPASASSAGCGGRRRRRRRCGGSLRRRGAAQVAAGRRRDGRHGHVSCRVVFSFCLCLFGCV